ncbi:MAG: ATP-binding protein [Bacteroidales bacterium]|nr:ATP-binding protein [Bacteroidales bacterium]
MKIAVASGKGGTGKTTISTNLASYISRKKKVILADLDVEEPNSGLFIEGRLIRKEDKFKSIPEWIEDNCTLCGNCQEVCNYNAVIQLGPTILVFPQLCHGCFACSELCPSSALTMVPQKMGELQHFENGKLSFVESRLDIGQEQATQLISQTNKYIDEHFPDNIIKIYDSPPGTSCPVIEATKDADFVILVTEPTPFGLHDLKLAVDTMKKLKKKCGVVINRHGIGNDAVMNYCHNENIPVISKIPNDRRIAELYSRGKLIYTEIPEMEIQMEIIRDYIMNNVSSK